MLRACAVGSVIAIITRRVDVSRKADHTAYGTTYCDVDLVHLVDLVDLADLPKSG